MRKADVFCNIYWSNKISNEERCRKKDNRNMFVGIKKHKLHNVTILLPMEYERNGY